MILFKKVIIMMIMIIILICICISYIYIYRELCICILRERERAVTMQGLIWCRDELPASRVRVLTFLSWFAKRAVHAATCPALPA